jgi:hypothetical protein
MTRIHIGLLIVVVVQPPRSEDKEQHAQQQPQQPAAANPLQPVCPACRWSKLYTNMESARKGFAAHKQHCKGKWSNVSPFALPVRPQR